MSPDVSRVVHGDFAAAHDQNKTLARNAVAANEQGFVLVLLGPPESRVIASLDPADADRFAAELDELAAVLRAGPPA